MSLERFADVIATNAVKILGHYPQKGAILPGATRTSSCSTPSSRKMIALEELHADSDCSIWDGFACAGYPVMTVLRGKVVVERGKLFGSLSDGRWLPRRVDSRVLSAPAV